MRKNMPFDQLKYINGYNREHYTTRRSPFASTRTKSRRSAPSAPCVRIIGVQPLCESFAKRVSK